MKAVVRGAQRDALLAECGAGMAVYRIVLVKFSKPSGFFDRSPALVVPAPTGHARCSHDHWLMPEGGKRPGDSS